MNGKSDGLGDVKLDEIGYWSEIKLDIIREYAKAYSINVKANGFRHSYIDAFSGSGIHLTKENHEYVLGSPLNALLVEPPFEELHFVDIDRVKTELLKGFTEGNPRVHIHEGDCNDVMVRDILPMIEYRKYRRALCVIDPYGLHLDWQVVTMAGQARTIDMFLNFPIMDMNRNALWHNPDQVHPVQRSRMSRFWGDETWREIVYSTEGSLFQLENKVADNEEIAQAYKERLRKTAGFGNVLDLSLPPSFDRN